MYTNQPLELVITIVLVLIALAVLAYMSRKPQALPADWKNEFDLPGIAEDQE